MSVKIVAPTTPPATSAASLAPKRIRIRSLVPLQRGDTIEARILDLPVHRGQVVETAPGIGALWIRKDGSRERKLLYADEYNIWLVMD